MKKIPSLTSKIRLSHRINLGAILAIVLLPLATSHAQTTYYFDTNGSTSWFGLSPDGHYVWDTSALWSTNSNGNIATTSWVDGSAADFKLVKQDTGAGFTNNEIITVELQQDVEVSALSNSNNGRTIIVAPEGETVTITALNNAIFNPIGGVQPDGIRLGDGVNLVGDITIGDGGYGGTLRLEGRGDAYVGTVTVDHLNPKNLRTTLFYLDSNTRFGKGTKVVMNHDMTAIIVSQAATIGELSGIGGVVQGNSRLTIDQDTNTEWKGLVLPSGTNVAITKAGTGRLSMTNTGQHKLAASSWNIEGGALYVAGEVLNTRIGFSSISDRNSASINVSSKATLGGNIRAENRVILAAADSVLDAGMFGETGTMDLAAGLSAQNGSTFHFDLKGAVASRINIGNVLELTSTTATGPLFLAGTKTINLYNIGNVEDILFNTPYILMDATDTGLEWDLANWNFNLAGEDWGILANPGNAIWDLTGNTLKVTFVPEPSSVFLLLFGLAVLVRRKR